MKILIEHYPDQTEFAEKLAKRLKSLKEKEVIVETYADILKQNPEINNKELVNTFNEYDIIIPIIAGDYSTNSDLTDSLEEFSELENKYLFPIIFENTQWSSVNWIVKSKVYPEDGSPFEELSEKSKAITINKIFTTIGDILFQKKTLEANSEKKIDMENIVFISHSHSDSDFAELLKLQLEKNGINAWLDNEKLQIGKDWRQEIDDGISKSIALIVIMSPEAKNSEYVTYEWSFGWGKDKPIYTIMLKQTTLHPRLESLQYLDFTNRVTRPWQKLIESISGHQKK